MFKLLLLVLIIGFGIYKVVSYVFRILYSLSGGSSKRATFRNFTNGNYRQQTQQRRRAPNSDLNIDYIPDDKKKKKGFGGGEYVDYEEVK